MCIRDRPPAVKGEAVKRDAEGNPMWTARGDREHPSSLGQVCIKGATVGETLAPGRLRQPLFRQTLEDDFAPISWDDALNKITGQIKASMARRSNADGVAMYGSGQFHTEDYYLAQKLLKGALGTNNFDANSRLCMSSAVAGYTRSLGSDGPPCSYEDLDHCTVAFLIGSNTAECHPVLFQRLLKRKRKNPGSVTIVVVDPRRTDTAKAADIHLPIAPGSDLALLHDSNGWLHASSAAAPPPLLVLLIDNGGGGIFQQLPIATPGFESLFAMPQQVDPLSLAAAHGVHGRQVACLEDLQEALAWGLSQQRPVLLRLCSDRGRDAALRQPVSYTHLTLPTKRIV